MLGGLLPGRTPSHLTFLVRQKVQAFPLPILVFRLSGMDASEALEVDAGEIGVTPFRAAGIAAESRT